MCTVRYELRTVRYALRTVRYEAQKIWSQKIDYCKLHSVSEQIANISDRTSLNARLFNIKFLFERSKIIPNYVTKCFPFIL